MLSFRHSGAPRLTMPPMKTLGDNLVVTSEVRSTLSTGVDLRAVQIDQRVIQLAGATRLRLSSGCTRICEGLAWGTHPFFSGMGSTTPCHRRTGRRGMQEDEAPRTV
jgi:hypothetical protein